MRLAKASALINTTWQRLIRVAWVPSIHTIVVKNLHFLIQTQLWSILWTLLYWWNLYPHSWWGGDRFYTLSSFIIGKEAGVTAARAAGFPANDKWQRKRSKALRFKGNQLVFDVTSLFVLFKPCGFFRSDHKPSMCGGNNANQGDLHALVMLTFGMLRSMKEIMKKSRVGGQHKWKRHKKTRARGVLPCCDGEHKDTRRDSDRSHWVTCTI